MARKKKQPRSKARDVPQSAIDYARLQISASLPYYFNPHHYAPSALPQFDCFAGAPQQPVLSNATLAVLSALLQTFPWPAPAYQQHAHDVVQRSAFALASSDGSACNTSMAAL